MGERLSVMSVEELHESRLDLINKLKAVNAEIEARKRSAGSSSSAVEKVVKKKIVTKPAAAAAVAESSSKTKKVSPPAENEREVVKPVSRKKKSNESGSGGAAAASVADEPKINATIADMKAVLDQNGIAYNSTIKKDELISMIRSNHLIRKAETRCTERKKNSAASRSSAAAADSDYINIEMIISFQYFLYILYITLS
jgi:hypothetical protein